MQQRLAESCLQHGLATLYPVGSWPHPTTYKCDDERCTCMRACIYLSVAPAQQPKPRTTPETQDACIVMVQVVPEGNQPLKETQHAYCVTQLRLNLSMCRFPSAETLLLRNLAGADLRLPLT